MSELEKQVYKIKSSLVDQEYIDNFTEQFKNSIRQPLNSFSNELSYEYYKGFYDATYNFMQTFNKLIEAGAFSGTKSNPNN